MSTAVFAGISAMNASQAAASAHAAKVAMCKSVMPNFKAELATVSEAQQYAECVNVMYPKDFSGPEVIAFKILFVIAIFGAAYGFWRSTKVSYNDFIDSAMISMMGFIAAPILTIALLAFMYGVYWLFT